MVADSDKAPGSDGVNTSRIRELVRIGLALSSEKRLENLLELIVTEARSFTNADGGTLYLRDEDNGCLNFAIIQNETLGLRMGGTGAEITWPAVPLTGDGGHQNHSNVSAHAAITGETVNIPDVYDTEGFSFEGTRTFDRNNGYRSRSMLVIPMLDHEDEVVGVLQLLNAMDRNTGRVIEFPPHEVDTIRSLASQAAVAVNNVRLVEGLQRLLDSFINSIASAIDEKSPYTGGHIRRVTWLSLAIARRISSAREGIFRDVNFSDEEMEELRLAALMHDVGKITTPESVVDKATRLEKIFDRIELIRHRVEILRKDIEIDYLRRSLAQKSSAREDFAFSEELKERFRELEEQMLFLEEVNRGGEYLSDERIERVRRIASQTYAFSGKSMPILSAEEMDNLCLRMGTLNEEERRTINNHVVLTADMLGNLPFPKKYANVPLYASAHHEKLDGSGYPEGLTASQLPLQARILAVADVFEALTAADRPYKKGKLLSEAVRILGLMVKDRHIDGDVCDILISSGLAREYAEENISRGQIDYFSWNPGE